MKQKKTLPDIPFDVVHVGPDDPNMGALHGVRVEVGFHEVGCPPQAIRRYYGVYGTRTLCDLPIQKTWKVCGLDGHHEICRGCLAVLESESGE